MNFIVHQLRDYQSHNDFKRLLLEMSGNHVCASYLRNQLWTELAYQAEGHGVSGLLSDEDAQRFERETTAAIAGSTKARQSKSILATLVSAGLIARRSDGYFCEAFARLNGHLDSNFVPPSRIGRTICAMTKIKSAATKAALTLMAHLERALPKSAWSGDSEARDRALVLIMCIDNILRRATRTAEEYEEGLVADACRIVARLEKPAITTILRRMHLVRGQGILPRSTADILRRWDETVIAVMPLNGFEAWSKQIKSETTP